MVQSSTRHDIGLIGLGVMGQSLALNLADHSFVVHAWDRDLEKTQAFAAEHAADSFPGQGDIQAAGDLRSLIGSLSKPRRIIILVPAGAAVDAVIEAVQNDLDPGDILIDCGNEHWLNTATRQSALSSRDINLIGSGISGGEQGARFGPSLMASGDPRAWEQIREIWTAIAAKIDPKTGRPLEGATPGNPINVPNAESCAGYIGPAGSGHFVKMVHNGIEYADMQLICEAYDLLRRGGGFEPKQIADIFLNWNEGALDSYLIQITADILAQQDPRSDRPFVDVVLDAAGQKGTGKWTAIASLDAGIATPCIAEAVFARCLSAIKDQRLGASKVLQGPAKGERGARVDDSDAFVQDVHDALLCGKISAYAQGFALLAAASDESGWNIDLAQLALIWRGGCIIRARFLQSIADAVSQSKDSRNLMCTEVFAKTLNDKHQAWRRALCCAMTAGIPTPAISSALCYYDGLRTPVLPANLLQAQRDYFGSHTYKRTDELADKRFHLDWANSARPEHEVPS